MRILSPALLIALALSLSPQTAFSLAEGTGLKFSGAVDLTGTIDSKNQTKYPKRFDVREAEFGIYGPIDHGFDGALFFAAHNEGGQYNVEVHEAYLASSSLIPSTRLKAGKFFLGVGRLNQIHRHDWPFISPPKAHETYFDEEAAADTGAQANVVFPFLPIYTELGLGVTNGWTFGHSHVQGVKPIQPTHYARLANFFPLGESGGLQTGLNYLGRNARNDGQMKLFGVDLVAKWREGSVLTWLLQSELWGRNLRPVGGTLERSFGGYLYGQRHLFGPLYLGLRLDGYSIDTSPQRNLDYSLISNLVYRHSEFLNFKLAYQLDYEKRAHKDSQVNRALQVQAAFLFGDHPTHEF
jgi:hypothetical protein